MPKPSRKPAYAKAFRMFCEGKPLGEIAIATGVSEENLAACAESQNWVKRRALIVGHHAVTAAETRIQAQIAVDSTLVSGVRSAANTLTTAYVRLIEQASALPVEPFPDESATKLTEAERDRAHRRLIRDKTEVMKLATSGLRELIETAQNVGLLKVERGGKTPDGDTDRDKPIDLSKLTQLNIAIVQATGAGNGSRVLAQLSEPRQPENVTPSPPVPVG